MQHLIFYEENLFRNTLTYYYANFEYQNTEDVYILQTFVLLGNKQSVS